MKCNSVLKHIFKGYSKKCNPLQGHFIDLIISLFYGNGDIVDFAYKFINSITFQRKIKNGILEISGKILIHYNGADFT